MKKIILLIIALLLFGNSYSQKKGGFRVGFDFGFVPTSGGGGGMFSIEPKYNIKNNMNIGLRIGGAGIARDITSSTSSATTSAKIAANGSFVGTYDYYFASSGKSFVPYIGAGVGYYSLANVEINDSTNSSSINPDVTSTMGGLVRAGFEWGKFRMGVEYNYMPDSDLQDTNGATIGTISNSYLGIHLGFFLGGGKWGK